MKSSSLISCGEFLLGIHHVRVMSNDEDFALAVAKVFVDLHRPVLPPTAVPIVFSVIRRAGRWEVRRDEELCEPSLEEGYVLFHLQWEFNRLIIETPNLSLHAATVEIDEHAIVLAGASMSGKTTLAGHLSSSVGSYLADEVSVIDGSLRVLPYHRPLGLRRDGPLLDNFLPAQVVRYEAYELLVPASSLGCALTLRPTPIGAIVFPRYAPDGDTVLRHIPMARALLRLCDNAPSLARDGSDAFLRLAELARNIATYELSYHSLSQAQQALLNGIGEQSQ